MMIEKRWFPVLLIVVFAGVAYSNTLLNGFAWDDPMVIVKNQALRGAAISLFSGIDTARDIEIYPYYRPLTLLSFLIEERIHSLTPLFMHMLNLFLHTGMSMLVYLLVESITKNRYTAIITSLLFAVHPVNSEGVAFLSGGRNTLLAACFALSAYLMQRSGIVTRQYRFAIAGSILFMAALFSKETALPVLAFIVALEVPDKKTSNAGNWQPGIVRVSPYIATCATYLWLRAHALGSAGATSEIMPGLLSRFADNIYIIPRYLATIIWPPAISIRYNIPDDLYLLALPLLISWITILISLGWLLSKGRSQATLFGLAWLAAFWLPTSGIIPFPSAPMADRYMYLPAIGIWLIIADQAVRLFSTSTVTRRYGYLIAVSVLVTLSTMTIKRNQVWKNDVTLFSDYVVKYPQEAMGHHNLGTAYLDLANDLEKAEYEFQKVLAINPEFPRLHTQMGYVRLLKEDYKGALVHYDEAVKQDPLDAEAHISRGTVLEKLGMYEEAIYEYKQFLSTPGNEFAPLRSFAQAKVNEQIRLKTTIK